MPASTEHERALSAATILIACAVLCAALGMGIRASFGLFLAPMTAAHGWTASGFAFAIAVQVLLNGVSQPLCGQVADRIGGFPVIVAGALLYAAGILGMALSSDPLVFGFFAGLVMGVAVSAAGMPVVISTLTRLLPEHLRGRAVGLGTAGSSFGQFLVVPVVGGALQGWGWQGALFLMAGASLLMIPLALPMRAQPLAPPPAAAAAPREETAREALARTLRDPSFWYLFFGFSVCGAHVSMLSVHLPGFVHSCGLPTQVGAGAISLIGLFNVAGSLLAGELSTRWRRRELLVGIYAARGVAMAVFLMVPPSTASVLVFAAVMGVLYLSTIPPTVALCARNFGTRWLATIFGLAFLGHQIGGFTAVWLGGVVFDRTGSYDLMWVFGILTAAFAAVIHLPVRDGPRPAPVAA